MGDATLERLHRLERSWDVALSATMMLGLAVAVIAFPYLRGADNFVDWLLLGGFGVICFYPVLPLAKALDNFARRRFVKGYYVEERDGVARLIGTVRFSHLDVAYRDLLKGRPGYRVVDNAHQRYGCTLAAVKMTEPELAAQHELEKRGLSLITMG